MTTTKFRAELYRHQVAGKDRWDFRIVRRRGGKIVAASQGQGYSRRIDAVATLHELGLADVDIVELPASV